MTSAILPFNDSAPDNALLPERSLAVHGWQEQL